MAMGLVTVIIIMVIEWRVVISRWERFEIRGLMPRLINCPRTALRVPEVS